MRSTDKVSKHALLVLTGLMLVGAIPVQYTDCGSRATVKWLDIDPCDYRYYCTFLRGVDTEFTVRFVPKETITSLKVEVDIGMDSVFIPFPAQEKDACKDSGLTCSLQPNREVTYHRRFNIKGDFPKVHAQVRFQLIDQNGDKLVCLLLNGRVDDKVPKS